MLRDTLKGIEPPPRATGAAMDRVLARPPRNYVMAGTVIALLLTGIIAGLEWVPRGLRVSRADIRIARVQLGTFRDDVVVRATVDPLHTTILDALDSGRVEEVLALDGAMVKQGELLYRLSNPTLGLDLVARQADRAQQISNVSNLRASLEASRTEHQRRMLDLSFALAQAQRQNTRLVSLARSGVIPVSTLEDSEDKLAQQRQAIQDEQNRTRIEMNIKRDGIRKMEQAIRQLDAGLNVVTQSIEALAVRAPVSGRLTDFHLEVGEIVKSQQHIGRIDAPGQFKLVAQIDEFFLARVSLHQNGAMSFGGHSYAVQVSRIFPQIEAGRFSIELSFTDELPNGLSPGQSIETRISLGGSSRGLILPDDAYLNDTGGGWVFVVSPDGGTAKHRAIHVGRRNNSQVEVSSGLTAGERVIVSSYAPFGTAQRLDLTN